MVHASNMQAIHQKCKQNTSILPSHCTAPAPFSPPLVRYYTCLSCCASARGTLIIQSLQPNVITGGCSGWLRQEFHDLEILDEIARLHFHSQLNTEVDGYYQNTHIMMFCTWKGLNYLPENLHPTINGLQNILILFK